MKQFVLLPTPILLCAQSPDRVPELVESMRELTFAGDQAAVSRIVPILIGELARPHPQAALAWNQIGVYEVTQGNFIEAERAYKRGIQLLERAGIIDGDLALLQLNLGELYVQTGGRPGLAEALLRNALKVATVTYGQDAPQLAYYTYGLGLARLQSGDPKDAREHFERALMFPSEGRDGKIGRGIILANLAVVFAQDKNWNQARDMMSEAVSLLEQNFPPGHPDLVPTYLNLSTIHQHFKQWDSAGAALEKARAIVVTRLTPEHRYMSAILNSQAQVLKKLGRRSEARELSRRAKALSALQANDPAAASWVHISDLKK